MVLAKADDGGTGKGTTSVVPQADKKNGSSREAEKEWGPPRKQSVGSRETATASYATNSSAAALAKTHRSRNTLALKGDVWPALRNVSGKPALSTR